MCAPMPFFALALRGVVRLSDGRTISVRPITCDDAEAVQRFIGGLSIGTARQRFFQPLRELSPRMLAAIVDVDYVRSFSLIAEAEGNIVGLAQYVAETGTVSADIALVIADAWQARGLGRHLLGALLSHATDGGLQRLVGDVLADNNAMLELARRFGFIVRPNPEERGLARVERELGGPWPANAHELASALWDMPSMLPAASAAV
jgi:acetyltransferase